MHNLHHRKEVFAIKWSPSGPGSANPNRDLLLATASMDGTARIWGMEIGDLLHTLPHSDAVYCVAFSPNGEYIATGGLDQALHVWSVRDGTKIRSYKSSGGVFDVQWSPRGDCVALCNNAPTNNVALIDIRF